MVRVEQTEFWSDVDVQPSAETAAFSRGSDTVYVDETSSLTGWFLEEEAEALEDEVLEALLEAPVVETPLTEAEEAEEKDLENPVAAPVPERPQVVLAHAVYADTSTPRFNMARFLTLTGSLDSVEEDGRYLVLPRGSFRPRVVLDAVRRISKDFLKDLRSPPRSYSISEHRRPSGWLQL